MPRSLGPLVGAIDQGTSSTRFLVFAANSGELITYHQIEVSKIYPNEGWVEQDPNQIVQTVHDAIAEVMKKLKALDIDAADIKSKCSKKWIVLLEANRELDLAIGLCNQRESTVVWDKITGEPLYNSIVWLDNRTTGIVDGFLDAIPGRDINFHKVS